MGRRKALSSFSPMGKMRARSRADRPAATSPGPAHANRSRIDGCDQRFDGRRIGFDTVTRLSQASEVGQKFRGAGIARCLNGLAERSAGRKRSGDIGREIHQQETRFVGLHAGRQLDFSRPGKPTDNAFIERLNGKFRAECLNANWFLSLDEARRKCEAWRRNDNEVRPHSAIGNQVLAMLHRSAGNRGQAAAR